MGGVSAPQPDRPDQQARVRVRRTPRFGVFIGIGVILGLLAALILTSVFPVDEKVGFAGTFGYLALYGVVIGLVLGALVAIVLDAILSRRAREVPAEIEIVESPERDETVEEESAAAESATTDPEPDRP
jgi:tetrahydromethanopterin S-methyltransferase subunit B